MNSSTSTNVAAHRLRDHYARAEAAKATVATYHCQARHAHGAQAICVVAVPKGQRFCYVHGNEHRALKAEIGSTEQAVARAGGAVASAVERYKSGGLSADAALALLNEYAAAVALLIQLEETHERRFSCAPEGHAVRMVELKRMQTNVMKSLDQVRAEEKVGDSVLEFALGLAASGVGAYFGIPWGRSVLFGALAMFGWRSARGERA
ncbi:hypothetical protein C8Q76DRAFT_424208 [Earliella scabrosa]|nr:hypothetical protein C8Q76DRAFT_424208 [Earliella scabrosa]